MILLGNGQYHKIGGDFTPDIEMIAFSLAHINRYTGHYGQYSVAQHCCHVANQLPRGLKLAGLLHDACEAYLGDVASPLKAYLPEYRALETHYLNRIDEYYEVMTRDPGVTEADLRMLVTEVKSFGGDISGRHWPDVKPYPFKVSAWTPGEAYRMFLKTFTEARNYAV